MTVRSMSRWSEHATPRSLAVIALLALVVLECGVFRATRGAGVVFVLLVAGAGAGAVRLREWLGARNFARALPFATRWAALLEDALVALLVLAPSAALFGDAWNHGGYRRYDWASHHANLRHLVDALANGHVPRWVQSVSTGDSPYELYPLFPYYLAARAALLFHARDLTLVLVRSGVVIHTLGALGAALLARRVIGWKWGVVVGWLTLFDLGSLFGGGLNGVLYLGVTHGTLATALWSFVLVAVVGALERPSLANSALIWILSALACLCHPIAIVSAVATMGGLVLVACLARDQPRHRAWLALGHVALGSALAAFVWLPFGERVSLYGLHYAWPADKAPHFFADLLEHPLPQATFAPLVAIAYVGIPVGVLSRRAAPTLVACHAALLLVGLVDQPYLLLDLVPSLETARFQVPRLGALAKTAVYVSAAYLLAAAWTRVAQRWAGRDRYVAGAVVALLAFPLARSAVAYFGDLTRELVAETHPEVPDLAGFRQLIAWARAREREERPGAYGRLLSDDSERYYSVGHVNAESGLPSFWIGASSALFLRERMEDLSPESVRRFDVRWVLHHGEAPSIGDPATERRFGSYFVREIPSWDGRFARVESGTGTAVVTRLDDERIEVDLRDTSAPALVALGMGYYPRWEAVHATRGAIPVYAYPATPHSPLSVPAAWLPPGRTTFRPSGALPSDGNGRATSILALLAALGNVVLWRRPRLRIRALRWAARARASLERHRTTLVGLALSAATVALVISSALAARRPTAALEVGSGLFPVAQVEERGPDGSFRSCAYAWLNAQFRCPSGARVFDAETQLLNEISSGWALVSPAIHVEGGSGQRELRISLDARLRGEYWAQTNGPSASLSREGTPPTTLTGERAELAYASDGEQHPVTLSTHLGEGENLDVTFVARRALDPDRRYPRAPDQSPLP
jgi:hypothetical protein